MGKSIAILLTAAIVMLTIVQGRKELVLSKPYSYYILAYEVIDNRIEIEIVAATLGYVGFGLSLYPNMTGADLFIGGVYPNGTQYQSDFHGTGNRAPVLDTIQDWVVESMSENPDAGTTSVSFTRLLDTGDKDDLPIKDEEMWVLWAIGTSDQLGKHTSHGTIRLNLLAP